MSDDKRLERCDREIAEALAAASRNQQTLTERLGVVIWEMDWRAERESILAEAAGGAMSSSIAVIPTGVNINPARS
jgi:hypothetical protein